MPLPKKIAILFFSTLALSVLTGCESFSNAMHDDPIKVDPHKRTFGQSLEDGELERIISINIKKTNDNIRQNGRVGVNAYNNIVLLSGSVPTEKDKQHAYAIADEIFQVRQIHNELKIGSKESIKSKIKDNYLKASLTTQLIKDKILDDDHFHIIVENGTVYLMGMVTEAQGARATTIARTTKGVIKVVKVFEYINP